MSLAEKRVAAPAVVALAVVALEGVVQRAAVAGWDLGRLGGAGTTEVEGVGEDAQEPDQAVQLAHSVLQSTIATLDARGNA